MIHLMLLQVREAQIQKQTRLCPKNKGKKRGVLNTDYIHPNDKNPLRLITHQTSAKA